MSFKGKMSILGLSALIALYAVVGGMLSPWTRAQQPINDSGAQMRIFESVLQHIQNDYVDDPNLEKVRLGALRGLAGGLDPYSSYLTADQVKEYNTSKNANKVGIGAEFSQVSLYLYVVSVTKGSTAEKAGLKAGDVIEYIEGKATRDISLYDAKQMVLGESGSTVNMRVLRSGAKPQNIRIPRAAVKTPQVETKVESGRVGVIKVFSLESGEAADIKNAVQSLTKQGVQKIVLDLRGVASGSIDEAVAVANLFIPDGELAKIVGKDNAVTKVYTADPSKVIFNGQMNVLIDLGTAGAGEVVAGAILDRKRGEVVGERSFGAGVEQTLFPLRSGDGLLLTVAKWASPAGKPFLGEDRASMGVKPSVEVKRPDTPEPVEVEELIDQQEEQDQDPQPNASPSPAVEKPKVQQEDVQLKKAIELLQDKAQTAKSGASE
ncbi:MAG TPA: S41 family peptidase [Pyrinomonadaceae bacterium]